jgi:hypothetical protein
MIDRILNFLQTLWEALADLGGVIVTTVLEWFQEFVRWYLQDVIKPGVEELFTNVSETIMTILTDESLPFIPDGVHVLDSFVDVQQILGAVSFFGSLLLAGMVFKLVLKAIPGVS